MNSFMRFILRVIVGAFSIVLNGTSAKRGYSRGVSQRGPRSILLTGTFYSQNWIINHIRPLAASRNCRIVWLVTTLRLPDLPKVKVIVPPRWLRLVLRDVPARLITFFLVGFRKHPDIVGGFHLLLNGLSAGVLSRLVGSRSMYFCGGGPREVLDGGIHGSRLFSLMQAPDAFLERRLIRAVGSFDTVVTMGNRSIEYFRSRGVDTRFVVIPGGVDRDHYENRKEKKDFDLIIVGRIEGVKRIDLLLKAVQILLRDRPSLTAAIVGAGSLERSLKDLAKSLNIDDNVTFAGYQRDVAPWLARSRVFVLTSDSEGMPLAVMEAMMSGLPCVVSDVGELGELVVHEKNGYLVGNRTPESFAQYLRLMLQDQTLYGRFSEAAHESALNFDIRHAIQEWDTLLQEM